MEMKRFFIVFYNYFTESIGSGHIVIIDSVFPSLETMMDIIYAHAQTRSCVITNISELSEQDYNSWVGRKIEQELSETEKKYMRGL